MKGALRRQHGALDDIRIEKDVGGMSALTTINRHIEQSMLKGKIGKEHAHDYVGESARKVLTEQISTLDPFNRGTREVVKFLQKVRGSPYEGLLKTEVKRFMKRKAGEFQQRRR